MTNRITKDQLEQAINEGFVLTASQRKELAKYIADYIQEEFYRGRAKEDIDYQLISDAIEAYEGGAR